MDRFGNDFDSATGSVMSRAQLEDQRRKRGECVTCGRKCFQKKLFKAIPITDHGRVLNGRCLNCHPLTAADGDKDTAIPAVSKRATTEDLERFSLTQSNLRPGSQTPKTQRAKSPTRRNRAQSARQFSVSSSSSQLGQESSNSRRAVSPSSNVSGNASTRSLPVRRRSSHRSENGQEDLSQVSRDPSFRRETPRSIEQAPALVPESIPPALPADIPARPPPPPPPTHHGLGQLGPSYSSGNLHGTPRRSFTKSNPMQSDNRSRASSRSSSRSVSSHRSEASEFAEHVPERQQEIDYQPTHQQDYHTAVPEQAPARYESSFEKQQQRQQQQSVYSSQESLEELQYKEEQQVQMEEAAYGQQQHHEDAEMQAAREKSEQGLQTLEQVRDNFVDILTVMRDYHSDCNVQSVALHELSEFQLSEEDSLLFSEVGGVELIANSMYSFPADLELQISGCRAIWNVSGTAQNQHEFVQVHNVLDIVLQSMTDFANEASLQEQAMAALANLGALEDNLVHMLDKGLCQQVVESMTIHTNNIDVLVKGCLVIANLSSHPTDLKRIMMDKGGGGALVTSMFMHPTAPELQEKALRGLRNLSANCEENKVELTNIGGVDAVIGAMQVHRDLAGVQEAGAWTLSNLASNTERNGLIGECGGIDVLIRALWVHADVVSVLEWCCRALFTLALNYQNSSLILDVGGIAAVVNAMQAHVDGSPVIQEMGCAVLRNLASEDMSKVRIVEEEALDAIVMAMVLYTDDENVQTRACEVLLQLSIAQNLKAMQASNVVELVQAASERFPASCSEPVGRILDCLESYRVEYG